MTDDDRQIEELVSTRLPYWIAWLQEFSDVNTHSDNRDGLRKGADMLGAALSDRGLSVREIEHDMGRMTIVGETGQVGDEGFVLLSGHFDTVFTTDHPFQSCCKADGKLIGPGALDMKGGIAAILLALDTLQLQRKLDELPIRLILTPDEERGVRVSSETLRLEAAGAKVGLVFEFQRDDRKIVVARKGYRSFSMSVKGTSGHAGRTPSLGVSAIHACTRILSDFLTLRDRRDDFTLNIGELSGGEGAVNIVSASAAAKGEIRFTSRAVGEEVSAQMQEIVAKQKDVLVGFEFECFDPPMEATEESLSLAKQYSEISGLGIMTEPSGGISDANFVAEAGVPTIDAIGVRGGGAHTDSEFVEKKSIAESAEWLVRFLSD